MTPLSSLSSISSLTPDMQTRLLQTVQNASTPGISSQDLASLSKSVQGSADAVSGALKINLPNVNETASVDQTVSMPSSAGGVDSFSNVLNQMVSEVNTKQVAANEAVSSMLSGGNVTLNQAVVAMEEANVSFQLMVEVRNKLLDAYQELMRMQV
jgi:flagellar hook-basal body complex protein FliE